MEQHNVVVFGANGMLARPVIRQLVRDGIGVKAFVRSSPHPTLPKEITVSKGDLKNISQVDEALESCSCAYVSVDTRPQDRFHAETEGLANIVTALKNHQKTRLIVLSAMGNSNPACATHSWWHLREKFQAQQIAKTSGVSWTILEPTWFMESLPLFVSGSSAWRFSLANFSPYWVAAKDMGQIISRCLREHKGEEKIIPVQGPEKMSFDQALKEFCHLYDPNIAIKSVPAWVFRTIALFSVNARELVNLFDVCSSFEEPAPDDQVWRDYGQPQTSLEAYVKLIRETGDFPRK